MKRKMPTRILYHGTRPELVQTILREGIVSPMGYDSPEWYMVAENIDDAIFHSYGVVFAFEIPFEYSRSRVSKWPGYPYLWKASPDGWYALRQPIPPRFIREVGSYYAQLIDGNHRAAAAMILGERTIPVYVGENYRENVRKKDWL